MDPDDRQAAWYRAVRDGTPRGRHYGAPLEEDPPVEVAEVEPEPPPVLWDDADPYKPDSQRARLPMADAPPLQRVQCDDRGEDRDA